MNSYIYIQKVNQRICIEVTTSVNFLPLIRLFSSLSESVIPTQRVWLVSNDRATPFKSVWGSSPVYASFSSYDQNSKQSEWPELQSRIKVCRWPKAMHLSMFVRCWSPMMLLYATRFLVCCCFGWSFIGFYKTLISYFYFLGTGSYSKVLVGYCAKLRRMVAIKKIDKRWATHFDQLLSDHF